MGFQTGTVPTCHLSLYRRPLLVFAESKFTEGYFLKNRGLSADFHYLLFTKEIPSYLKFVVAIFCCRIWLVQILVFKSGGNWKIKEGAVVYSR